MVCAYISFMPFDDPLRRTVLGGLAAAAAASPTLARAPRTVALLGDSISAGYGLPARDALPAQLEAELARLGQPARIRTVAVSGDTTARSLSRLGAAPAAADLWVVALGGNDLLQGVEPSQTRANLDRIVGKLAANGAPVLLTGLRAPPFLGAYAAAFDAAFSDVARTRRIAFLPDLLGGVGGVRALNQPDGIHPNAAGVKLIARRMAPAIQRALAG